MGTIGNHTAVMNNDQIVGSVSDGVYRAVVAAFAQMGGQLGGGDTTIVFEGDLKNIFNAVRKEAKQYTLSTGQAAFPV